MTADIIRNATLVIATGMASACWATVVVFSSGTYQRTRNSVLAHCNLEAFVMWASAGILCNASFLRVYRHWKLLYRKDRSMWLTEVRGGNKEWTQPAAAGMKGVAGQSARTVMIYSKVA